MSRRLWTTLTFVVMALAATGQPASAQTTDGAYLTAGWGLTFREPGHDRSSQHEFDQTGARGLVPTVLLGGGGFTWHYADSQVVASCDTLTFACMPVDVVEPAEGSGTLEWTATAGLDVPVRVSRRVAIAPGFRLLLVHRRRWLVVSYDHRSPAGGDGLMALFGATVRWTLPR